jgi:hypothetical protein
MTRTRLRFPTPHLLAAILLTLVAGSAARAQDDQPLPADEPALGTQAVVGLPYDGWKAQSANGFELAPSLETILALPAGAARASDGGGALSLPMGIDAPSQVSVSSCPDSYCHSTGQAKCYKATFPELEWQFCAVDKHKRGLWIENVRLDRDRSDSSVTPISVLYEAGPMEVFVPYHRMNSEPGVPRAFDMQYCNNTDIHCQRALPGPAARWAGATGTVESFAADSQFVIETRERGLAHLCHGPNSQIVRRGQEVVLWALHDPGNYDNIIEYRFRDDGTITLRAGVTGFNNNDHQYRGHMHNILWRIDMDLNGAGSDTPYLKHHFESGLAAWDDEDLFGGGYEGSNYWNPNRFTTLVVEDAATNGNGSHLGYELQPIRTGSARHFSPDDWWTRRDFLVTRYHNNELETGADNPSAPRSDHFQYWRSPSPDAYLMGSLASGWPLGISNHEPIDGQDLVLWHVSSAHHDPHDEDKAASDVGIDQIKGITQIHWSGADLVPHNLFDHNPLDDGPERCGG